VVAGPLVAAGRPTAAIGEDLGIARDRTQPAFTVSTIEDIREAFAGRSSGSRIILLAAPSNTEAPASWHFAAFVPDYSGVSAADSHGVPS